MQKLFLTVPGIIPIYKNYKEQQLVNAREFHEWLGNKDNFTTWINDRIKQYDFIENIDYTSFLENTKKPQGGRPSKEYIITLEMAKELSMVERTDKGKEARQYFIKCEKQLKEASLDVSQLSPELQIFKSIFDKMARQELENKVVKEEIAATKAEIADIREVMIINPSADWRKQTNLSLNKIGKKINNYKLIKEEAYAALEERGKCKLKIRLENLQGRALREGMAPSKVNELNYLDVIANEPRLKEIYISIIKELAIKYKV